MANVFNSDVHKQQYDEGVMAELRDSIPMSSVSKVRTDNVEYIHNRYGDDDSAENTTDGTYTVSDATYSADSKLIDKEAVKSHRIRYKDIAREGFDIAIDLADRHGFAMAEAVHRNSYTVGVDRALSVVDNEVLAGSPSALTPITMSASNPDDVGVRITQVLQEANAYGEGTPFLQMSPKQAAFFNLFSMGNGFEVADSALRDGLFRVNRGGLFGLDTIVTNEVLRSRTFIASGNVSADDTFSIAITIEGVTTTVTWTFKATPAAAGEVDIGASAQISLENLAAAITNSLGYAASAGSATSYIEVTAANRKALRRAGLATSTTATTLTVRGFRYSTMTENLTNVTAGTYTEIMLAGIRNGIEIVMPSNGYHSDEKPVTGFNGVEVTTTQVHDAHVFQKNRAKIVKIPVVA